MQIKMRLLHLQSMLVYALTLYTAYLPSLHSHSPLKYSSITDHRACSTAPRARELCSLAVSISG